MKKRMLLEASRMVVLDMVFMLAVMSVVQEIEGYTNCCSAEVAMTSQSDQCSNTDETDELQFGTITPMTASCFGVSDGSLSFSVLGGTAPYTADLTGGITSVAPIMNIRLPNLSAR